MWYQSFKGPWWIFSWDICQAATAKVVAATSEVTAAVAAFTLNMAGFIRGDMNQRVQGGLDILLPAADMVQKFGDKIKLYHITELPQAHLQPHLILNLSEKPDKGMPSVNKTTNRVVTPGLIHFGKALPHTLQEIWGAYFARAPSGFQKLMSRMRTTAGTSVCTRWETLRTLSHRIQRIMVSKSELIW